VGIISKTVRDIGKLIGTECRADYIVKRINILCLKCFFKWQHFGLKQFFSIEILAEIISWIWKQ